MIMAALFSPCRLEAVAKTTAPMGSVDDDHVPKAANVNRDNVVQQYQPPGPYPLYCPVCARLLHLSVPLGAGSDCPSLPSSTVIPHGDL